MNYKIKLSKIIEVEAENEQEAKEKTRASTDYIKINKLDAEILEEPINWKNRAKRRRNN